MCRSQGQHQHAKKVHAIEQSESEKDMFIGTVKEEHEKYTSVMESGETESEEEKWTEALE